MAEALNARGIQTPRGRKWEAMSVKNALARVAPFVARPCHFCLFAVFFLAIITLTKPNEKCHKSAGQAGANFLADEQALRQHDVRALALAWLRENSPQVELWQVVGLEEFSQEILQIFGIGSNPHQI